MDSLCVCVRGVVRINAEFVAVVIMLLMLLMLLLANKDVIVNSLLVVCSP